LARMLAEPSPDLYAVADFLVREIGRDRVEGRVVSIVQARQAQILRDTSAAGWSSLLRKLNVCGVITTNWDTILSELLPFPALVWPRDAAAFVQALQNNDPFVLYLHGNVETRPLVITSSDCDRVAATIASDEHHVGIAGAFSVHYVMVVGYGFPDAHIRHVFSLAAKCAGRSGQIVVVLRQDEFARRGDFEWMPDNPTAIRFRTYDNFRDALVELASYCEPSSYLALVPTVTTVDGLREVLVGQLYDFQTAWGLRGAYRKAEDVPALLNLTARFVAEAPPSDRKAQGLAATMLSTLADRWNPPRALVRKLDEMCRYAIGQRDTGHIAVVEPLVFSLAQKGRTSTYADHLRALVEDRRWRSADVVRSWDYYGRADTQINAIERHLQDPYRAGITKANDTTRLLSLLFTEPKFMQPCVERLIGTSLQVLKQAGEDSLVKKVMAEFARTNSRP